MPLSAGKLQFSSTTCGRNRPLKVNASSPFEAHSTTKPFLSRFRRSMSAQVARPSSNKTRLLRSGWPLLISSSSLRSHKQDQRNKHVIGSSDLVGRCRYTLNLPNRGSSSCDERETGSLSDPDRWCPNDFLYRCNPELRRKGNPRRRDLLSLTRGEESLLPRRVIIDHEDHLYMRTKFAHAGDNRTILH
jgi:hypothetical protein